MELVDDNVHKSLRQQFENIRFFFQELQEYEQEIVKVHGALFDLVTLVTLQDLADLKIEVHESRIFAFDSFVERNSSISGVRGNRFQNSCTREAFSHVIDLLLFDAQLHEIGRIVFIEDRKTWTEGGTVSELA